MRKLFHWFLFKRNEKLQNKVSKDYSEFTSVVLVAISRSFIGVPALNLAYFHPPSTTCCNREGQGLRWSFSGCFQVNMLSAKCTTQVFVDSFRSNTDSKWIGASTCGTFSNVKIVQVQSKLANVCIDWCNRITAGTSGRVGAWISRILYVGAVFWNGWSTWRHRKGAAHTKACGTVPICCPTFTRTFWGCVACSFGFIRRCAWSTSTLAKKNKRLTFQGIIYLL